MNAEPSADRIPSRLTWTAIQSAYADEPIEHQRLAHSLGLDCPDDVFEQFFRDHHSDGQPADVLRFVDWSAVTWEEGDLSGGTWIRAPILVTGDVLQSLVEYELLVGFTRLGNLLGALDRQDLPEYSRPPRLDRLARVMHRYGMVLF